MRESFWRVIDSINPFYRPSESDQFFFEDEPGWTGAYSGSHEKGCSRRISAHDQSVYNNRTSDIMLGGFVLFTIIVLSTTIVWALDKKYSKGNAVANAAEILPPSPLDDPFVDRGGVVTIANDMSF